MRHVAGTSTEARGRVPVRRVHGGEQQDGIPTTSRDEVVPIPSEDYLNLDGCSPPAKVPTPDGFTIAGKTRETHRHRPNIRLYSGFTASPHPI